MVDIPLLTAAFGCLYKFLQDVFADAKKHTLPIIIELSVFVNPYFSVSGDLLYEYETSQECYIMFT